MGVPDSYGLGVCLFCALRKGNWEDLSGGMGDLACFDILKLVRLFCHG